MSLVDKNLLRAERHSMLETIREYAFEQLAESGETKPRKFTDGTPSISLHARSVWVPKFRIRRCRSRSRATSVRGVRLGSRGGARTSAKMR